MGMGGGRPSFRLYDPCLKEQPPPLVREGEKKEEDEEEGGEEEERVNVEADSVSTCCLGET